MKLMRDLRIVWKFIRGHPTILYSMILVVVVPLILVFNSWWTIRSFRTVLDAQIQRRAILIHDTLSLFVRGSLKDMNDLSLKVQSIEATMGMDIADYTLLIPDEQYHSFNPVVGFSQERHVDKDFLGTLYAMAWTQDRAIASIIEDSLSGDRLLIVTKPITDLGGARWGLANVVLSLATHDALISQAASRSTVVMVVGIVIVLLLIANHVRMFEYAVRVQRLEEAEQLKDDFISVASHELRTPITGVQSFLSLLDEGSFGQLNDEGKKYVKDAIKGTGLLTDLVEDMLDVSRIEQGRMEYNPETINPAKVIEDVVGELRYQATQKGLSLEVIIEIEDSRISVDPHHMRRVLVNLIGNSIKYTKKGSVVVHLSAPDKKRISISIRDTGVGIPPDKLETLFKKFSRVHSDETAEVQGTGLGLWITRALTEKMGGNIYVSSIQGKGTEFTVMFDRVREKQKA